ncbi:MAG: GNAT family N-acetyltransferase [Rhodospirillales bacterium]|nr:MAG: GNAT family N-acetyltransferase [Rhodospirillales bacterium]
MPIRNLNKLFYPHSVAVIGASNREGDAGNMVMHNLLQGGFEGPIMPVSHDQQAVAGVLAYDSVQALPRVPDLAVLCTPPEDAAAIVLDLGGRGTGAVVLLAAGVAAHIRSTAWGEALATARRFGIRVLGPNCMGVMVPHIGLNASLSHVPAMTGSMAFVSQSSVMSMAVLDWARQRDIGFSHFVSVGEAADIDFGDALDFLGSDAMTRAILLYIEAVHQGRSFMSAGRGASRNKPVLVIKGGRVSEGQRLAQLRTGLATGADDVYDAAIRRAGMLRVFSFGELFAAVETLGRATPLRGDRLAVLANGYGVAIMAADTLVGKDGHLARLSPDTEQALTAALAGGFPGGNPVSLATDAPPEAYAEAARILLNAAEVDAVMVLHVPTAMASSTAAAEAVIRACKTSKGTVLTSWLGGESVAPARRRFAEAAIPTYDTPTQAIDAFMHMVRFRRNQEMLMETPVSMPEDFTVDTAAARRVVDEALAAAAGGAGTDTGQEGHPGAVLDETASDAVLRAYRIPTTGAHVAASPDEAVAIACQHGFPVDITLTGGPSSDDPSGAGRTIPANTPDAVSAAVKVLLGESRSRDPDGGDDAVLIKPLPLTHTTREVRLEITTDPVFGPVLVVGQGGPAADVLGDRAVTLPPLNSTLAWEVVRRTRIARALEVDRDGMPAGNLDALILTLVKLSQLLVDIPEIISLDINPLLVDDKGVFATETRIRLAPAWAHPERRLAIRPYPKELEETFRLRSGQDVLLRPIRPEDEPEHYEFLSKVSLEDIRFRFFGLVRRLPHTAMARLTQIDYDREMAFIATAPRADRQGTETLGVVRTITDPNNELAEYAILVRSDLKGQTLGWKLMEKMIAYCRSRGTRQIVGQVLRDNNRMLRLVESLGFTARPIPGEDVMEVVLQL